MVLQALNIYYLALYRKLGPWFRPNGGHLLSPAVSESIFRRAGFLPPFQIICVTTE